MYNPTASNGISNILSSSNDRNETDHELVESILAIDRRSSNNSSSSSQPQQLMGTSNKGSTQVLPTMSPVGLGDTGSQLSSISTTSRSFVSSSNNIRTTNVYPQPPSSSSPLMHSLMLSPDNNNNYHYHQQQQQLGRSSSGSVTKENTNGQSNVVLFDGSMSSISSVSRLSLGSGSGILSSSSRVGGSLEGSNGPYPFGTFSNFMQISRLTEEDTEQSITNDNHNNESNTSSNNPVTTDKPSDRTYQISELRSQVRFLEAQIKGLGPIQEITSDRQKWMQRSALLAELTTVKDDLGRLENATI